MTATWSAGSAAVPFPPMAPGEPTTVDAALRARAVEHPDATAVVDADGTTLTYAELDRRAAAVAAGLGRLGLARGDTVGAWYPNRSEWLVLLAAAARLGVGVVGLNTRFRRTELVHLLGLARCRWVLVASDFLGIDAAGVLGEVAAEVPLRPIVVGPTAAFAALDPVAWDDLAAGPPAAPGDDPAGRPDDLLVTFTTSGTTGFPKLAGHHQAGTLHHALAVARAFEVAPGTATLVPLPLCGTFGLAPTVAALVAGGRVVLHDTFDPGRCARAVSSGAITHLHGADEMLLAVLRHPDLDPGASRWTVGVFADFTGAGEAVVALADEVTGGRLALSGVYGSSEGWALMCRWPPDAPPEVRRRNGGLPVSPRLEVRACDPDTGEVLGPDVAGELQFRGPNLTAGYLHDEAATARSRTPDGWFRSGDLGSVGADGSFTYQARLGDSLRLRGFLVDPSEIEHHLARHPAVDVAQVVGAEVRGRGQVAVAFVRLHATASGGDGGPAPVDEDELRRHCADGLAGYKVPARIEVVDAFPVTDGPNGVKVRKVELRERAAALVGGAPTHRPPEGE